MLTQDTAAPMVFWSGSGRQPDDRSVHRLLGVQHEGQVLVRIPGKGVSERRSHAHIPRASQTPDAAGA